MVGSRNSPGHPPTSEEVRLGKTEDPVPRVNTSFQNVHRLRDEWTKVKINNRKLNLKNFLPTN